MSRPIFSPYNFNPTGMQNMNPYGGYNNFTPYGTQPQMQPQMQPQEMVQEQPQSPNVGMTIQTIQSSQNLNPQAVCYFVAAKEEMQNLKIEPNTFYIGINKQAKEMYVRTWNNDGNIDFNTYTMTEGKKETSGITAIIEKLENIENKLVNLSGQVSGQVSDQVSNQPKVKENNHEQYTADVNAKPNGWSNAKRSPDGTF